MSSKHVFNSSNGLVLRYSIFQVRQSAENNYTGDRLSFCLAAEKARSQGIIIESVVVADDVSLLSTPGLVDHEA